MKVSVCIATYNGAQYIRPQILSILNQEFTDNIGVNMEVIISDDNSQDDTISIIESLNDSRIKIYNHTKKKYPNYNSLISATKNFENAIELSSGDYIFLSDQDDIWYPNKIDSMLNFLKEKACCICAFNWIDQYGNHIGQKTYSNTEISLVKMLFRFPYYGFCFAFNKKIKEKILPIPLIPQHDIFIGLVAKFMGELAIYNVPLCDHRKFINDTKHTNVSDSGFKETLFIKLFYRSKLIFYSIVRSV